MAGWSRMMAPNRQTSILNQNDFSLKCRLSKTDISINNHDIIALNEIFLWAYPAPSNSDIFRLSDFPTSDKCRFIMIPKNSQSLKL